MMRLSLLSIVILIYYRITAVISVHNIVTRTDGLVFLNYAANDENQPPMYETDEEEYEINAPLGEALDDLIPFTNGYYGFKLASKSAKNIYGQWGLSLKRWIFRDENTAIGIGLYEHDSKSDRVTIKCSRNKLQNAHDEYILRLIDLAKKQRNFLATGSRWVSQRLHDFWVGKYHCMVTSNPGHMSFRQLVVNLREDDKPKVLPWYYQMLIRAVAFLHFAGVAHNNINPDNIRYVRGPRGSYGEMVLTNYTQATTFRLDDKRKSVMQAPVQEQMGFDSPESVVNQMVNVMSNDGWMTGMVAYFGCANYPLFGFTSKDGELRQQSTEEYTQTLTNVYNQYKGMKTPIPMERDIDLCMQFMLPNGKDMLIADPDHRPTPMKVVSRFNRALAIP